MGENFIDICSHVLPCSLDGSPIPRIQPETMRALLCGKYRSQFKRIGIVDCRYDYEFQGGHITGAANLIPHQREVLHFFKSFGYEMKELCESEDTRPTALIFHCEFSKVRGPRCARHFKQLCTELRERDEAFEVPEIYVMKGGYCHFFQLTEGSHPSHFTSMNYVPMRDPWYKAECKLQGAAFLKSWDKRRARIAGRSSRRNSRSCPKSFVVVSSCGYDERNGTKKISLSGIRLFQVPSSWKAKRHSEHKM